MATSRLWRTLDRPRASGDDAVFQLVVLRDHSSQPCTSGRCNSSPMSSLGSALYQSPQRNMGGALWTSQPQSIDGRADQEGHRLMSCVHRPSWSARPSIVLHESRHRCPVQPGNTISMPSQITPTAEVECHAQVKFVNAGRRE